MTKLSKESILPLAGMLTGMDYTKGLKQAMEHLDWDESMYGRPTTPVKGPLTKKQTKARAKAKAARKVRKRK
jgi:hypothetical protein